MTQVGNTYDENFFQAFQQQLSGGTATWRVLLQALNGTNIVDVEADANGYLTTVSPADSYTLGYDGSNQLTTITRASDSKVITFTWVAGNLTAISDWA